MDFPKTFEITVKTVEDELFLDKFCLTRGLRVKQQVGSLPSNNPPDTTLYKFPKESKDFWGAEYLNPKGEITYRMVRQRLFQYALHWQRLLDDGIKLDEDVMELLHVDSALLRWVDLPAALERFRVN